jgi:hypothetical protein
MRATTGEIVSQQIARRSEIVGQEGARDSEIGP